VPSCSRVRAQAVCWARQWLTAACRLYFTFACKRSRSDDGWEVMPPQRSSPPPGGFISHLLSSDNKLIGRRFTDTEVCRIHSSNRWRMATPQHQLCQLTSTVHWLLSVLLWRKCSLQVAAQAFTFIMGGYETTASMLAFAVHFIAQHQHVEDKLLAEIDAFGRAAIPSYDDCDQVILAACEGRPGRRRMQSWWCWCPSAGCTSDEAVRTIVLDGRVVLTTRLLRGVAVSLPRCGAA
jgi:Cytochrome P450